MYSYRVLLLFVVILPFFDTVYKNFFMEMTSQFFQDGAEQRRKQIDVESCELNLKTLRVKNKTNKKRSH